MDTEDNNEESTLSMRLFDEKCQYVKEYYNSILYDNERRLLQQLLQLNIPERRLVYAIYSRKTIYFFPSKCFVKIANLQQTILYLIQKGYLVPCEISDFWPLLQELSMKDIKNLMSYLGVIAMCTQQDLQSKASMISFLKSILNQTYFIEKCLNIISTKIEKPYKLNPLIRSLLTLVQELYSPISNQLSIILTELGKIQPPLYPIFPSLPAFSTRSSFDLYSIVHVLQTYFHSSIFSTFSQDQIFSISSLLFSLLLLIAPTSDLQYPSFKEIDQQYQQLFIVQSSSIYSSCQQDIKQTPLSQQSIFHSLQTILIQLAIRIKQVLTQPQLQPSISIQQSTEYTINNNHTNSFYQEQVNYLIRSLPHLLPMISLKKLQQQYHYSTLLLSCVIHYIQFLHDSKYYDQAFSLSFFIIQHSLYEEQISFLWKICCSSSLSLFSRNQQLKLFETAIQNPNVIGSFRIWIHKKYLTLAVQPYRFNPIPLTFLPYSIRYINDSPLHGKPGYKNIYFNEDNESLSVEGLVLEYYQQTFHYSGCHDEGKTIRILFFLLLWDCIYLPLPFAFQNPYEILPVDFGGPSFWEIRQNVIEVYLKQIADMKEDEIEKFIDTMILIHKDIQCPIDWKEVKPNWLKHIASGLGGVRLACICKRLCKNYNYYASGLPDLLLLREVPIHDGNPSVLFVEVKGENDRLSEKQLDWIEFFQQNSFNFELCKISKEKETGFVELSGRLPIRESSMNNQLYQSSFITPTNSNQSIDKKRESPVTTPVRLSQNMISQSNSNESFIITPTNSNQSIDKKRESPATTPIRLSQNIISQSNSNESFIITPTNSNPASSKKRESPATTPVRRKKQKLTCNLITQFFAKK